MLASSLSLDILSVFQRYTRLTPGSRSGKQWQGACPFPDCSANDDGFIVWPEGTGRGCHYYCRVCGRAGDVLAFVCTYEGISRRKARALLGLPSEERSIEEGPVVPHTVPDEPPGGAWQKKAMAFLHAAIEQLWSAQGLPAREYLHQRGFPDEIIRCMQLGYHQTTCLESASGWGIAESGSANTIWLPRGIVIPWFAENTLWKLTIRRGNKDIQSDIQRAVRRGEKPRKRKYVEVQGSANFLYGADSIIPGYPVLLVESELDAVAAMQAGIRDIIGVVATGSTGRGRTQRALSVLAPASRVLIAFDVDENGRGDEAAAWWIRTLPHATRWKPWAHDVNEMLQQHLDIRTWVSLGLEVPPQAVKIDGATEPDQERWKEDTNSQHFQEEIPEPSIICGVCGAEVEYYVEVDAHHAIAYCAKHWAAYMQPTAALTPEQALEMAHLSPLASVQEVLALGAQLNEASPAQLVLDLETTGLDPRTHKIITIALGTPGNVMIIDLRSYYRADAGQQQAWKEALQYLLHRDTTLWIGHNLKFDWLFLAHQLQVKLKQVYDTMLVEKLLHAGSHISASLLSVAERYDITVTKEQRSWFIDLDTRLPEWAAPLPEAQLAYIRQDIEVPYQLYERQQEAIVRHGLASVVSLEHQALPAIAAMEAHGVCVDVERWRGILSVRREQKAALERQIKQILGVALSQVQPTQEVLFGQTRLPQVQLTSSDQLLSALRALGVQVTSVSKEALQEVARRHPVIPLLLEWKALEKFETAFGENLLSYVTMQGRIHATFDQLGAASGRVICREPNLQQIPKPVDKDEPYDLRRCFVAPEGHVLLIADLSNIELRILAEVSDDTIMQRFFAEGKDLHSETARLMFHLSPDVDPKKHLVNGRKARDIAKAINFGLAYGMGAQGLANRVGVDLATAKRLMQTYFTTYKAVSVYLARSGREGIAQGYALSLSGRKRFFSQEELKAKRGETERSAKNHPIQGTNADILKRALALLYAALPVRVHIILVVHDEIVLECPDELRDEAARILKASMLEACRDYLKFVHIPEPDVLIGPYWQKD